MDRGLPHPSDLTTTRPEPFFAREVDGIVQIVDARGEDVLSGGDALRNAKAIVAAFGGALAGVDLVEEIEDLETEVEDLNTERDEHEADADEERGRASDYEDALRAIVHAFENGQGPDAMVDIAREALPVKKAADLAKKISATGMEDTHG
jgi:hypothetical protein